MKADSQLQQDLMAELKWEPAVHAAQIGVEVKNGVVTLAGEVSSYTEKLNAVRVAQRVDGVRAPAVEMKVKLSQFGKRADADIAESAKKLPGLDQLPACGRRQGAGRRRLANAVRRGGMAVPASGRGR